MNIAKENVSKQKESAEFNIQPVACESSSNRFYGIRNKFKFSRPASKDANQPIKKRLVRIFLKTGIIENC